MRVRFLNSVLVLHPRTSALSTSARTSADTVPSGTNLGHQPQQYVLACIPTAE
jgi:hypothetical protein